MMTFEDTRGANLVSYNKVIQEMLVALGRRRVVSTETPCILCAVWVMCTGRL